MTTEAKTGIGTTVQMSDVVSPLAFTAIAEIVSAAGPSISAEEIDVTTLDSTGGFKESISGLKDGGTLELELLFTKNAQQVAIRTAVENGTLKTFLITWPTSPNTTAQFNGTPLTWGQNAEANSPLNASVSVKISGAITWT
jgi:predicted secreted protein